jgi:hypothetical protein
MRPSRTTASALTYELRVFVFGPHHAPLHVRLELLDRQGRRVGSSRRVTLPAGQNTRPIRVRPKRGIVVRRPAFGGVSACELGPIELPGCSRCPRDLDIAGVCASERLRAYKP